MIRNPLWLAAALCFSWARPDSEHPSFILNGGFGFFASTENSFEISEWVRIGDIENKKISDQYGDIWIGASQGYYYLATHKVGYLEAQFVVPNYIADIIPVGFSAGVVASDSERRDWRGTVWVSFPFWINFTGQVGFETDHSRNKVDRIIGGYIKIPFYACCNVLSGF